MASSKTASKATRDVKDQAPEMDMDGIDIPQGMEMQPLRQEFDPIVGFLKRPDKKDASPVTFCGVLLESIEFTNDRKQKAHWFVMASTQDQECVALSKDEDDEVTEVAISKGDRVGISESGAIKALAATTADGKLKKRGHFVVLKWTGEKVTTKNGEMWEILAQISAKPIKGFDPDADELPF